jgi:hypothetical protein
MLGTHREKTSHPSKSPLSFHSPRTDTCNNDAAPETADFDFNRFNAPQD